MNKMFLYSYILWRNTLEQSSNYFSSREQMRLLKRSGNYPALPDWDLAKVSDRKLIGPISIQGKFFFFLLLFVSCQYWTTIQCYFMFRCMLISSFFWFFIIICLLFALYWETRKVIETKIVEILLFNVVT